MKNNKCIRTTTTTASYIGGVESVIKIVDQLIDLHESGIPGLVFI
jgi:hypothetical protein